MIRTFIIAIATVVFAGVGPQESLQQVGDPADEVGGFQLAAATPGTSAAERDAVVVITTLNCAEPKNAKLSARVISVDASGRSERLIALRNVAEGRYVLDQRVLAEAGEAATLLVVDGRYKLQTAALLVGLEVGDTFDGDGPWVGLTTRGLPTRMLTRTARRKDITHALAKLSG